VTESKVFHKGGGSTPGNSYRKYLCYYNSIKNRLTTLIKTFSESCLIVAILGTIFITVVRIFRAGFSKDLLVIRGIIDAIATIMKSKNKIIFKRLKFQEIKRIDKKLRKLGILRPNI
jgi:hypothetical protein